MESPNPKASMGVLGVGAAACAACCAGPIAGFLAATGIASLLGMAIFGFVGLLAVPVVAAVLYRRRRRQQACARPSAGPVTVDVPKLKVPR